MENATYKIIWNNDVISKKRNENETINSEPVLLARMFALPKNEKDRDKLPKPGSKAYEDRKEFCTYKPVRAEIVVRPLKDKIMFRFLSDHFTWNTYEAEINENNYFDHLNNLRNEIVKEFPTLYDGVNFISHITAQEFWNYRHTPFLSI